MQISKSFPGCIREWLFSSACESRKHVWAQSWIFFPDRRIWQETSEIGHFTHFGIAVARLNYAEHKTNFTFTCKTPFPSPQERKHPSGPWRTLSEFRKKKARRKTEMYVYMSTLFGRLSFSFSSFILVFCFSSRLHSAHTQRNNDPPSFPATQSGTGVT